MSTYRMEAKLKSWIKATTELLYVFLLNVSPAAFGADGSTFGDKLTFPNPNFAYAVSPDKKAMTLLFDDWSTSRR